MMMCWAADPQDRPTFESLATNLAQSLAAMADYLTLGQGLEASLTTAGNNRKHSSPRYVRNPMLTRDQYLDSGYVDVSCQEKDAPRKKDTNTANRKKEVNVVELSSAESSYGDSSYMHISSGVLTNGDTMNSSGVVSDFTVDDV